MPTERPMPGSPAEWLARARGDLALARVPLPAGGFYEDLCFHAQQAAEKAIKAVYRRHARPSIAGTDGRSGMSTVLRSCSPVCARTAWSCQISLMKR